MGEPGLKILLRRLGWLGRSLRTGVVPVVSISPAVCFRIGAAVRLRESGDLASPTGFEPVLPP